MRMMLGCLTTIAVTCFAITFLVMLLVAHDASWSERLSVSAMLAAIFTLILATAVQTCLARPGPVFEFQPEI